MDRKQFIRTGGLAATSFIIQSFNQKPMELIQPQTYFFDDDGIIPNSKYPLLLYRDAFTERGDKGAAWLKARFALNGWTNDWRWGVYPFHHYHSNTHEVLGVFSGTALLHLGGENGKQVRVEAGDIIVIPAGVGHKCVSSGDGFTVVGAYPKGLDPNLHKGENGERPQTDKNIAALELPALDPITGNKGGLLSIWR